MRTSFNFIEKEGSRIRLDICGNHHILVTGWNNISKAITYDLFKLHPSRKQKFTDSFKRNLGTKIVNAPNELLKELKTKEGRAGRILITRVRQEINKLCNNNLLSEDLLNFYKEEVLING